MKRYLPRRWHRWFYFEYWPVWLFYLPAVPYWLLLSLRSKTLLYFTAVNPGIEHGGFFGESKAAILKKIPQEYKAKTFFFEFGTDIRAVFTVLATAQLDWPLVCKPDNGERGYQVAVVHRPAELQKQIDSIAGNFIVQEFIAHPLEFGIFYHRFPNGRSGITSIVQKEFLSVRGDGNKTVKMLMAENLRSLLQIERFEREKPELLLEIPARGEQYLLEHIGNHSKGTKFLNANHLANPALVAVFDRISIAMQGIHFGRFDLKVSNLEDLYLGKNIRILEFNGATSEVAHIYQPGYALLQAYKDVFYHMRLLQQISMQHHQLSVPYSSFVPFIKQIHTYLSKKKDSASTIVKRLETIQTQS